MRLLDVVLGAVAGNSQGAGGDLSGIIGMVANNPQLLQAVTRTKELRHGNV